MKNKWNDMIFADKAMIAVRIIASCIVIVFAALQLLGVWENAINFAVPLLGVVLLLQSIQEWKAKRKVALFGFCTALFIFVCTAVVWSIL